jgi:hypothetical protein
MIIKLSEQLNFPTATSYFLNWEQKLLFSEAFPLGVLNLLQSCTELLVVSIKKT